MKSDALEDGVTRTSTWPEDNKSATDYQQSVGTHVSRTKNVDRILVVDDEPAVRTTLKAILKKAPFWVDTADNFQYAVDLIEKRDYKVVIADIFLTDVSGLDLLRHVRKVNQQTQLIAITGDPNVDTAADAVRAGAYDYISKPIRREAFLAIVKKAVDKANLLVERKELEAQNRLYQKHLESLVEQRTAQLRQSELKYRTLFEFAHDSIFLLDCPSGKIVGMNRQAELLTHLKRDILLGKYFWSLNQESHGSQLKAFCKKVMKQNEGRLDDARLKINGREICRVDLSAKIVELGDQRQVQVLVHDITEKKLLEEKQREMELELVQEQKLATIGMMASGIAHNINSPLMGIMGLAQLMIARLGDWEELKSIMEQANKIATIVKNLMYKSRSEAERLAISLDINRLLSEELRFLESDLDFKHGVEKDYQFQEPLPSIQAIYSDFSQSFNNIIRNALDAMYKSPRKRLSVRTHSDEDWIFVDIEDTGCGIAKRNIKKIFSPFFSTKPIRGKEADGEPTGTGLGLSSAYKLLSPYRVEFDVNSAVGQGTCVTVKIPYANKS